LTLPYEASDVPSVRADFVAATSEEAEAMSDDLDKRLHGEREPPVVMGIVNVTPDSFSDGGAYASVDAAVAHAARMIDEGAEIIDVGPESTRPGSEPVSVDEQIRRAVPVIGAIRAARPDVDVAIDTRLAAVASAAIEAGATMVNDVSALRDDPAMAEVVSETGTWVVLMHRRGTPATMQTGGGPAYHDVIVEIAEFLQTRVDEALEAGVARSRIVIDPGIGFGKRVEHNLQILKHVPKLAGLGYPLLIGMSRKHFLGMTLSIESPKERDEASAVAAALAVRGGARIVRAHAVAATVSAIRMAWAIEASSPD